MTKTIGGKKYAYLVRREGGRVVTKYIGPAGSAEARRAVEEHKSALSVPEKFRALFWDTELKNIDLRRNASYVIERVLELGDLDALNWIQRVYPARRILDAAQAARGVSDKSRRFWRLWFGEEAA